VSSVPRLADVSRGSVHQCTGILQPRRHSAVCAITFSIDLTLYHLLDLLVVWNITRSLACIVFEELPLV